MTRVSNSKKIMKCWHDSIKWYDMMRTKRQRINYIMFQIFPKNPVIDTEVDFQETVCVKGTSLCSAHVYSVRVGIGSPFCSYPSLWILYLSARAFEEVWTKNFAINTTSLSIQADTWKKTQIFLCLDKIIKNKRKMKVKLSSWRFNQICSSSHCKNVITINMSCSWMSINLLAIHEKIHFSSITCRVTNKSCSWICLLTYWQIHEKIHFSFITSIVNISFFFLSVYWRHSVGYFALNIDISSEQVIWIIR